MPCSQALLESFNKVKAAEDAAVERKYGSMDPVEKFRAERSAAAGKAMWAERKDRAGKEVVPPVHPLHLYDRDVEKLSSPRRPSKETSTRR